MDIVVNNVHGVKNSTML